MPGGDGFFPPVQYSPFWLILGVVIMVLIVGWYVFVFVSTRRRPAPVDLDLSLGVPGLSPAMREQYLDRIDDVGRRYVHGDVAYSQAHHELSALVRTFASEARGVRAQYMTLDDLRRTPHRALAETVEALYPGAFSGDHRGGIDESVARATRLVREWN
jgi:hypothetical protein